MIADTFTSPVILFFLLGALAALIRSDLAIPEAFAKAMSIYLMAAIGLKGGTEVATSGFSTAFASAAGLGIALSFTLPLLAFALLTRFGGLGRLDAAAVSAHYGSVSVVTFVTSNQLLSGAGLAPAGFMVAVLALMETPAIITGLALARKGEGQNHAGILQEVFSNGSVVLLAGSFCIGIIVGKDGYEPIKPLFTIGFTGVLCLFLLDMGLIAVRRLMQSRRLNWRILALAIAMPIINGSLGVTGGTLICLDVATAASLGILAASASYIAVPAAMRLAIPDADPGIYLTMSLAVTFPFNIIVGITLFSKFAQMIG